MSPLAPNPLSGPLQFIPVYELRRIVRFAAGEDVARPPTQPNGYGGNPPMSRLGAHHEVEVICRGEIGTQTGYLADIKTLDNAVRSNVCPIISGFFASDHAIDPADVMPEIFLALRKGLPEILHGAAWKLSPYYSLAMTVSDPGTVLLRQRFDFAAAHRLHNPALSDRENRDLFGKCNLPSGHGHNYQVEPCVAIKAGERFGLPQLEEITGRVLIERFDHKHLNLDCPEFSAVGGVNPTVENIARVFYDLLAPHIRAAGVLLQTVTVWETDRTSCTYPV